MIIVTKLGAAFYGAQKVEGVAASKEERTGNIEDSNDWII